LRGSAEAKADEDKTSSAVRVRERLESRKSSTILRGLGIPPQALHLVRNSDEFVDAITDEFKHRID